MSRRYRPSARALFTDLQDGTSVLLHLDSKAYFELNETATFLWKHLASQPDASLPELADAATTHFEVSLDDATPTIAALLDELLESALLELV